MMRLALVCCALLASAAAADDSEQRARMFTDVDSLPCARMISATDAVGCGSTSDLEDASAGEGGSLFLADSAEDVRALNGDSGLSRVSVVVSDALLDGALARDLLNLHNNRIPVDSVIVTLADAASTPATSGAPTDSVWTSNADGLNSLALPFPVTRVRSASDSADVRTRARSNRDRGYADAVFQHAARFNFFQGPLEANSPDCLRRARCDPIGGLSVWASLGPLPSAAKETVLLAANMDATALFHDLSFGRDAAASGIVASLLAADAVAQVGAQLLSLPRQIAVALFNAETADRAGSRRFVRDIGSGLGCRTAQTARPYNGSTCADPAVYATAWTQLALPNVTDVIAVSNVANGAPLLAPGPRRGVFAHTAATGANGLALAADFASVAAASAADLPALLPAAASGVGGTPAQPVPPSPLDSFLRARVDGFAAAPWPGAGLVLTGFDSDTAEANPRLETRFDRSSGAAAGEDAAAERVADAALLLARLAFVRAGGSVAAAASDVQVNRTLARELWRCLAVDFTCALLARTLGASAEAVGDFLARSPLAATQAERTGPAPLWPGIYAPFAVENAILRPVPVFARDFLAQLPTTDASPREPPQGACGRDLDCMLRADAEVPVCALGRSALACIQGRCACVNAYFHDALSPALSVSASGAVSVSEAGFNASVERLWTEVRWQQPTLQLFQRPNGSSTAIALIVSGLFLTALTYVGLRTARQRLRGTRLKLD